MRERMKMFESPQAATAPTPGSGSRSRQQQASSLPLVDEQRSPPQAALAPSAADLGQQLKAVVPPPSAGEPRKWAPPKPPPKKPSPRPSALSETRAPALAPAHLPAAAPAPAHLPAAAPALTDSESETTPRAWRAGSPSLRERLRQFERKSPRGASPRARGASPRASAPPPRQRLANDLRHRPPPAPAPAPSTAHLRLTAHGPPPDPQRLPAPLRALPEPLTAEETAALLPGAPVRLQSGPDAEPTAVRTAFRARSARFSPRAYSSSAAAAPSAAPSTAPSAAPPVAPPVAPPAAPSASSPTAAPALATLDAGGRALDGRRQHCSGGQPTAASDVLPADGVVAAASVSEGGSQGSQGSSPPRAIGAGEAVHYTAKFIERRRRMRLHATYTQHLAGVSGSDLSARIMALVYGGALAANAGIVAHWAGYGLASEVTLISGCAYAVVAANWPPAPPSSSVEGGAASAAATQQVPIGPRWRQATRAWLRRVRSRLKELARQAAEEARAREHATLRIQARCRGRTARRAGAAAERASGAVVVGSAAGGGCGRQANGHSDSLANGTPAHASDLEAGQLAFKSLPGKPLPPATNLRRRRRLSARLGLDAAQRPALAHSIDSSYDAFLAFLGSLRTLSTHTQASCCQWLQPLISSYTAAYSASFAIASGIQLLMTASSVIDFHACLLQPPARPVAFAIVFLSSLIPVRRNPAPEPCGHPLAVTVFSSHTHPYVALACRPHCAHMRAWPLLARASPEACLRPPSFLPPAPSPSLSLCTSPSLT